jgi:hypothetical protein
MNDSNYTIKVGSGTYNFLDKIYKRFIIDSLTEHDEDTKERFYTYDSIMSELILLGEISSFEEIKYRLTGGEEPNQVMVEVLNRDKYVRDYLWTYLSRIDGYIEDDIRDRFTK